MKNRLMMLTGLVAVTVGFGAWPRTARAAEVLEAGDPAPGFSLPGSDGKTYRLSELQKPVVLAWFPKAFTGGCTAECKSLRASGDALRKFDVAYFTISCDDAETNRKFAQSLELDFPILSDPTRQVATAYGVVSGNRTTPARWTFYIGADGKILFIDKQVKTGSHGEDVAAKLKELKIGEKK